MGGLKRSDFGEFSEWAYVDVLTYKPKYIEFLLGDIDDAEIPEKKRFAELIQRNNVAIAVGETTGASEWKKKIEEHAYIRRRMRILDNSRGV